MRQTSIDAYHQIREEGLLTEKRFEVYEVVAFHGPLTSGEVWSEHLAGNQRQTLTPRFIELARQGVIEVAGKRPCRLTGRTCIVWRATKNLPVKIEKPRLKRCPHCKGSGKVELELEDFL